MQHLLSELAKLGLLIIAAPDLIHHAGHAVLVLTKYQVALVDPLAEPEQVHDAFEMMAARQPQVDGYFDVLMARRNAVLAEQGIDPATASVEQCLLALDVVQANGGAAAA